MIKKLLFTIALSLQFAMPILAQNENVEVLASAGIDSETAIDPLLEAVIASYIPWESVEFSGKLNYEKLPFSPTIKIYAVKDSLVQISLRAPIMGEVGRLNLTKDELLVVNKLKKTYCSEDPAKLFELYPTAISDIQNILLARAVVLGDGEIGQENSSNALVEQEEGGNILFVPQTDPGIIPFNYGYIISPSGRTLAMLLEIAKKASAEIRYSFKNRGEQIGVSILKGSKTTKFSLDFTSVKWGGNEMQKPKTLGYEKLSVKEFLKNLI